MLSCRAGSAASCLAEFQLSRSRSSATRKHTAQWAESDGNNQAKQCSLHSTCFQKVNRITLAFLCEGMAIIALCTIL